MDMDMDMGFRALNLGTKAMYEQVRAIRDIQ